MAPTRRYITQLHPGTRPRIPKPLKSPAPLSNDAARFAIVGEPINETRRQELTLRTGALQNAILRCANIASIATDDEGVVRIFNVGAEHMLGYTAAEVVNRTTPADFADPLELIARAQSLSSEMGTVINAGFEAMIYKASLGLEDSHEATYIRRDGSRLQVIASVTALRDEEEQIIGYLLIATDDGARKRAEGALVNSGALQKAIFNSSYFSCIATDENGIIRLFNVGAERMLGYKAAEVVNKMTPADMHDRRELAARADALSTEFGTRIAPGFDALVFKAARGIADIYELTKIRKDGSRFPAIVSVTPLQGEHDAIIGYLLIGTDNSARKQAEDALVAAAALQSEISQKINIELEQRVKERTNELEAANNELEAFSYSVSHDLRAPLRAIDGFSQAVVADFGPALPEEGQRYLQTIRYSAQRMGALIDDLLAFARLSRQPLNKRLIDTGLLVRETLAELGSPWPERRVEVRIEELPECSGDPALLKQVWVNLLSNALKYTSKREIAVIEVGTRDEGGVTAFFVRDNGTGFDMRYADKLFGVFQRFHRVEDYEGTGVGLAIVQRIIHRHGGRIWGEAAVDRGATFTFTLEPADLT
jgi:signal transduction histidine kinase